MAGPAVDGARPGAGADRDLGFGAVVGRESRQRLLNRDGTFNVRRGGPGVSALRNPYHTLLGLSWPAFLGALTAAYVGVNALFALLYLACGPGALLGTEGVAGAAGPFLNAFFFSVHTFATIGYGNVTPTGVAGNVVASFEALCGLLSVALATGLLFARFSRPTARILYSHRALVAPYQGGTAFEFRIMNERSNQLIQVQAQVLFTRLETIADGRTIRQYYGLPLERPAVTFFPLAWTIVHPIVDGSPLQGLTPADLAATEAEFLVLLTAIDETFSQQVHSRSSYRADEVVWGAKFRDVFNRRADGNGVLSVNVSRLHEYEPA